MTNKDGESDTSIEDATIIESETLTAGKEKSPSEKFVQENKRATITTALWLALLAIAAVAYVGWISFQQAWQLESLAASSDRHHQQMERIQQSVGAINTETINTLALQDQNRQELALALQDANIIIDSHARRLRSLTATTTDDWRLAEAEYLLRLANQRILISKDSATALVLLNTADQVLSALADPRFFSIRKSIADDRAALILVGQQDLDGVFLQLSALSQQIDNLPLVVEPMLSKVINNPTGHSEGKFNAGWEKSLSSIGGSTWREIKSLVVIQKRELDIEPLLPPEHQYYLRSNLRLLLSQSQLALLDGRQLAYNDSLKRAEQWLQDYFSKDEHSVQAVLEDVQRLQAVAINIELPDVTNSLLAIKAFISGRHDIDEGSSNESKDSDHPVLEDGIL